MSNDNDPIDDAMREIEAALEILIDRAAVGRGVADQRVKVLALIRSKLPQPDAEHERAVEAWRRRAMAMANKHRMFLLEKLEIDEALRLMRARPQPAPHFADRVKIRSAIDECRKDEAAGELLRAAKALLDESDIIQCDNPSVVPRFLDAIAKAERAGIKP